jgi:hypothetical protein
MIECSAMVRVKSCARCGREIEWRKKWKDCWEEIRYCSEKCRGTKLGAIDAKLGEAILELLGERPSGSSICPSEVARRCFEGEAWRGQMERTRQAARRLMMEDRVEITQAGQVVDPSTAKGPIRIRRGPSFF